MSPTLLAALCLSGQALATEGPWTTPAGQHATYTGVGIDHFRSFTDGDGGTQDAPSGVTRFGAKQLWAAGLTDRFDVGVEVPYVFVVADDPAVRSQSAFATTSDFSEIRVRLRYLALTETWRRPAVALRGSGRSGFAHSDSRHRITNAGEGTTDLGVGLSAGKIGLVGPGFLTVSADVDFWYRIALDRVDGQKIPANEARAALMVQYAPHRRFGLSVVADGFHRFGGYDLGSLSGVDADHQWAALDAAQLKVGGKLMHFAHGRIPNLTLSAYRAVLARNNPNDTWLVELGVGFAFDGLRTRRATVVTATEPEVSSGSEGPS